MTEAPVYDRGAEAVWFTTLVDGALVRACIGRQTLHYQYRRFEQGDDPLETYIAHASEIDAAVRRRVLEGAVPPVMIRDFHLRSAAPDAEPPAPGSSESGS